MANFVSANLYKKRKSLLTIWNTYQKKKILSNTKVEPRISMLSIISLVFRVLVT
jgi:hypothetical protein